MEARKELCIDVSDQKKGLKTNCALLKDFTDEREEQPLMIIQALQCEFLKTF